MDWDKALSGAKPVSLEEMLEARENRASLQRELLAAWKRPLICFTLNIPGEYKVFPLAERCFEEGKALIMRLLWEKSAGKLAYRELRAKTGLEAFFGVDGDARELKAALMPLELAHPLGRLFDIDVFDAHGLTIHRADLNAPQRTCLICGGPVWVCARSRAHAAYELLWRVIEIMRGYFDGQAAEELAQKAVRALMTEVCVTPKPGLVDRADNGSHGDMDMFCFIDSSCALFGYFRSLALYCLSYDGELVHLLERIRFQGLLAEDAMLAATGGANTQKGAIFTLGILCAAAGYLRGKGLALTEEALFSLCAVLAGPASVEIPGPEPRTNGEAAFLKHGVRGIRGEAGQGFPSVREHALPVLRELRERGCTLEEAAVVALLHLVAHVDDTNMIARAGLQALRETQAEIRCVLAQESDTAALIEYAKELNRLFIARRMSPGGCADLLAAAVFADSLLV